jgi:hypothetical protein
MAFNPITLDYDTSVQGEILRNRDDQSKVKFLNLKIYFSIEP